jgi:hypothetical protein
LQFIVYTQSYHSLPLSNKAERGRENCPNYPLLLYPQCLRVAGTIGEKPPITTREWFLIKPPRVPYLAVINLSSGDRAGVRDS